MSFFLNGKKGCMAYYNGRKIAIVGAVKIPAQSGGLSAPEISIDGSTLTMTATDERTETFAVFVDGVEVATVEAQQGTTVETEENASGGLTYTITSNNHTFENGVLTIGE